MCALLLTKWTVCGPPFVVYKDGCSSLPKSPGLVHYAYRTLDGSNYNPLIPSMGKVGSPYACSSRSTSLLSTVGILTLPAPPVQPLAVQLIMVAIKLLEESFTLPPDIPASGRSERRTGYYYFLSITTVCERRRRMMRMVSRCLPFIRQTFTKRYENRHWKPSLKFWKKRTTRQEWRFERFGQSIAPIMVMRGYWVGRYWKGKCWHMIVSSCMKWQPIVSCRMRREYFGLISIRGSWLDWDTLGANSLWVCGGGGTCPSSELFDKSFVANCCCKDCNKISHFCHSLSWSPWLAQEVAMIWIRREPYSCKMPRGGSWVAWSQGSALVFEDEITRLPLI